MNDQYHRQLLFGVTFEILGPGEQVIGKFTTYIACRAASEALEAAKTTQLERTATEVLRFRSLDYVADIICEKPLTTETTFGGG